MQQIGSFGLETHAGAYESWPPESRLFFDGQVTGTSVPGYVIEAQYRCTPGYLLITSRDCPFEESSDFILLSDNFQRLAHRFLGEAYESFLLHAHWPAGEGSLMLHYYRSLFFRLSVRRRLLTGGYTLTLRRILNPESDPSAKASLDSIRDRNL